MKIDELSLSFSEKVVFNLRALFESYGYSQYKMSKFEEYDLYARNKDFLISDGVITFTDNMGKLLALKPDVTLSIIKNGVDRENHTDKLYYNENVYRTVKGSGSFKEIVQAGLECIGDVDFYNTSEVLVLAYKSLVAISPDAVLDIGDSGFVAEVIDAFSLKGRSKAEVLTCIREKNSHELMEVCRKENLSEKQTQALRTLVTLSGRAADVLPKIIEAFTDVVCIKRLEKLQALISVLEYSGAENAVRVDFSVVEDINYYNGIVFKGFIRSIPAAVLSGGQYDGLMKKMKRKSGAIGFAVYLDALERLADTDERTDVDTVVLYDDETDEKQLCRFVADMTEKSVSVSVHKSLPADITYKNLVRFVDGEVKKVENDA